MYVVVSMKAVLFLTMEEYKIVLSKNKIALWKNKIATRLFFMFSILAYRLYNIATRKNKEPFRNK